MTSLLRIDLRERLRAFGTAPLRDDELLALVLRTGRPGEPVQRVARRILDSVGSLRALAELEARELEEIPGIGPARAASVIAALSLGRRAMRRGLELGAVLDAPERAARHVRELTALHKHEEFHLLMLDIKSRVLGHRVISIGTLQSSLVHPREVFRPAIRSGAASILVAHNHPSGDATPSDEDRAVTERLESVGTWVGIPLLDHLVIGEQSYWSFAQRRHFSWHEKKPEGLRTGATFQRS